MVLIKTEPAGLVAVALKFHQQRDIVRFSSGLKKVEDRSDSDVLGNMLQLRLF